MVRTESLVGKGGFYNSQIIGVYFLVRHGHGSIRISSVSKVYLLTTRGCLWIFAFKSITYKHDYKRNHHRPSTLSEFAGITITDIC